MKNNKIILFFIAAVLLGSFTNASSHVDPSDRSHDHSDLSGLEGDAAMEEWIVETKEILDNTLPQLTDAVSVLLNNAKQNMVPIEELERRIAEATQGMVPIEELERRIAEATQNMVPIEELERRIAEAQEESLGEEEVQALIQEAVKKATEDMVSGKGVVSQSKCKALGEDILSAFDKFAESATWNCACGGNRGAAFDIQHSAFQVENEDHKMRGSAGLLLKNYVGALHTFAAKLDIDWQED
jgi:hypothetical protein